jgi:hypothetical protein
LLTKAIALKPEANAIAAEIAVGVVFRSFEFSTSLSSSAIAHANRTGTSYRSRRNKTRPLRDQESDQHARRKKLLN